MVYEGKGRQLRDTRVANGTRYRYTIISFDRARNRSAGVSTAALPGLLLQPRDGARVTAPPSFVWKAVRGASYYNFQLYRGSRKVLSAWPRTNRFKLSRSWKYGGRREALIPGDYRWYVWPGIGRPSATNYGRILGERRFTVVPAVALHR